VNIWPKPVRGSGEQRENIFHSEKSIAVMAFTLRKVFIK